MINEHFIKAGQLTNDIFLQHIGNFLIGEHVESLNCLYKHNINFDEIE